MGKRKANRIEYSVAELSIIGGLGLNLNVLIVVALGVID